MKIVKLNEKGMTAVEVLVCFILVVVITVSMYTTVSTYKNKQQIEAYKEQIYTYKNLLSKDINDDIIKGGLVNAEITEFDTTGGGEGVNTYSANLYLRDGTTKVLKIKSVKAYDYLWDSSLESELPAANDQDDFFMVWYGDQGKEIMYPIPDLGESENPNGKKIKDLRINNVEMKIQDTVFVIYIGFYHPDLGHRYAIDIVCPINYSGLSEGDGYIDPSEPLPPEQTPDPTDPIIPSPSPSVSPSPSASPSPSPSPSASPSPSPSPSASPAPGVEAVVSGASCERGGNSICWFTTSIAPPDAFATTTGLTDATGYDFDVTVMWTTSGVKWQCWGTGVKGFGWWNSTSGIFGGYRCWEGSTCYTYLMNQKGTATTKSLKISNGTNGSIQSCSCLYGQSC